MQSAEPLASPEVAEAEVAEPEAAEPEVAEAELAIEPAEEPSPAAETESQPASEQILAGES
jgi:hypothetical protein